MYSKRKLLCCSNETIEKNFQYFLSLRNSVSVLFTLVSSEIEIKNKHETEKLIWWRQFRHNPFGSPGKCTPLQLHFNILYNTHVQWCIVHSLATPSPCGHFKRGCHEISLIIFYQSLPSGTYIPCNYLVFFTILRTKK